MNKFMIAIPLLFRLVSLTGCNKAKPESLDDDLYMDGYKEGKVDQGE
jgi:hypothetical protein